MSNSNIVPALLRGLQDVALAAGASLKCSRTLLPLNISMNAKTEFAMGVLACVAAVFDLVCQSPEGRQAALDLGFQPLFQDVEGPRHGGSDD